MRHCPAETNDVETDFYRLRTIITVLDDKLQAKTESILLRDEEGSRTFGSQTQKTGGVNIARAIIKSGMIGRKWRGISAARVDGGMHIVHCTIN
jgi:hypothetical protein